MNRIGEKRFPGTPIRLLLARSRHNAAAEEQARLGVSSSALFHFRRPASVRFYEAPKAQVISSHRIVVCVRSLNVSLKFCRDSPDHRAAKRRPLNEKLRGVCHSTASTSGRIGDDKGWGYL